jgi:hypothetical protein
MPYRSNPPVDGTLGWVTDATPNANYTNQAGALLTPESRRGAFLAALVALGGQPRDGYDFVMSAVATGADLATLLIKCERDLNLLGVAYTPEALITGVNTNTRQLQLINKGRDGSGNVVVASVQFNLATNAPAGAPFLLTAGNLVVREGEQLEWRSNHIGSGLADPGGLLTFAHTSH